MVVAQTTEGKNKDSFHFYQILFKFDGRNGMNFDNCPAESVKGFGQTRWLSAWIELGMLDSQLYIITIFFNF